MKKMFNKKVLHELILPAAYLVAVLVTDAYTPIGTITPFFLVVGMLYLAVALRPGAMIPWTVIYTGVVCVIFLDARMFTFFSGHPYYDQYVIPIIRAATYIIVGGIFSYFCVVLNRLRNTEMELTSILKNLPWPILTSDHNGRILYWNESAEILLPELIQKNLVSSYWDLLAPADRQGHTISKYINRLEIDDHHEPLELSLNGRRRIIGHTQNVHYRGKTAILTILAEPDILRPSLH